STVPDRTFGRTAGGAGASATEVGAGGGHDLEHRDPVLDRGDHAAGHLRRLVGAPQDDRVVAVRLTLEVAHLGRRHGAALLGEEHPSVAAVAVGVAGDGDVAQVVHEAS